MVFIYTCTQLWWDAKTCIWSDIYKSYLFLFIIDDDNAKWIVTPEKCSAVVYDKICAEVY